MMKDMINLINSQESKDVKSMYVPTNWKYTVKSPKVSNLTIFNENKRFFYQ